MIKSTVIPGTTDSFILPLIEFVSKKQAGRDFGLCMNPEFLREGSAVQDFLQPDRIVIGGIDERSIESLGAVYSSFKKTLVIKTNAKTAEFIKYTANALFASLISFTNEIANLCAKSGNVDVMDVMQGVYADRRITSETHSSGLIEYLKPGCGFGGSCFPKDLHALASYGKQINQKMPILEAVLATNSAQPMYMSSYLTKHFQNLQNLNIGILGIAFKPETNDIRSSPALVMVEHLMSAGANIYIYDPVVKKLHQHFNGKVKFIDTLKDLICEVDAVLLFTTWSEFSILPELIAVHHPDLLVIDGRRMLPKQSVKNYEGIGL